jgi:fructose-bisphosphate aldolase class II
LTQKSKKLSGFRSKKFNTGNNPVDFVFHGGSGSTVEEIRGISYGVIK